MKNKIKVIDISIVSTYMGRYLTAVVAVLVLAITLSALLSAGGSDPDRIITVGVEPRGNRAATREHFAPLCAILERETGLRVRLEVCDEGWPATIDLFVMSTNEFWRVSAATGLVAVYSVEPSAGIPGASIIAAGSLESLPDDIGVHDVLYTAPRSINGFWLQLRALEESGAVARRPIEELSFTPPPGHPDRVVYAVAMGRYRLGAVPRAAVARMIADGRIARNEVSVVTTLPSLPETVLCRREKGAPAPPWLRDMADRTEPGPMESGPVLQRIGEDEMGRLDALFEYVESRSQRAQRP